MKPGQSSPYLDLLKSRLQDCRIEVLPGLGHFPQLEAPDQVNALIEDVAASLRAGARS